VASALDVPLALNTLGQKRHRILARDSLSSKRVGAPLRWTLSSHSQDGWSCAGRLHGGFMCSPLANSVLPFGFLTEGRATGSKFASG
jgi:hypothetical protein